MSAGEESGKDDEEPEKGPTPRSWNGIGDVEGEDAEGKAVSPPKPFGDIQDVTAKKMLSEIGVRTYLAYAVVGVFLLCMLIYVIRMVWVSDSAGLTNGISILVGIVGLVMGYFFGTEEGQRKD